MGEFGFRSSTSFNVQDSAIAGGSHSGRTSANIEVHLKYSIGTFADTENNGENSGTMHRMKQIIEGRDSKSGLAFDLIVQLTILISLVSFSLETIPNLGEQTRQWLHRVEVITVSLFSIEYLLRVAVADKPKNYIFSFFGIVDLVAILPFFLSSAVDLRAVRIFRFLRLFRIFKLVRYSNAIRRLHRALIIAREEITLYFCVTGVLLYLAAVGVYYFENEVQPESFASVFHSLWWAVVTLTTVGYGDVYPITVGGRIFTFGVLLIGIGVVSVPAGLVASALSAAREIEDELAEDGVSVQATE